MYETINKARKRGCGRQPAGLANRIYLALFGIQNRTSHPYLAIAGR
jgi:hypothetical protein